MDSAGHHAAGEVAGCQGVRVCVRGWVCVGVTWLGPACGCMLVVCVFVCLCLCVCVHLCLCLYVCVCECLCDTPLAALPPSLSSLPCVPSVGAPLSLRASGDLDHVGPVGVQALYQEDTAAAVSVAFATLSLNDQEEEGGGGAGAAVAAQSCDQQVCGV